MWQQAKWPMVRWSIAPSFNYAIVHEELAGVVVMHLDQRSGKLRLYFVKCYFLGGGVLLIGKPIMIMARLSHSKGNLNAFILLPNIYA